MGVCFVDTETTGLDADRHQIWEVGLITPDGIERQWLLPVDQSKADPFALDVGHFWQRYQPGMTTGIAGFCAVFQELTAGHHLAGAVVSFDEERLRRLFRSWGFLERWHYHLVDVEALVAGKLGIAPPWNSNDLSLAVGVDPADFDRHTALGDARWAKAIYEAVMS